ncbi:MAG: hypothetical protein WCL39_15950, partial [Armatimonadota bacterium]
MASIQEVPCPGDRVDVAPFGEFAYWTGNDPMDIEKHSLVLDAGLIVPVEVAGDRGSHFGIEWEEPRHIHCVMITYEEGYDLPDPSTVKVQYRQHTWPAKWKGGWTHIDDAYHGRWLTAQGQFAVDGASWTYEIDPLDIAEHEEARNFAVPYRQSSKLRVLFTDKVAPIREVRVTSDSVWREIGLVVQYVNAAKSYSGDVSVYNGYILEKEILEEGLKIRLLYADCHTQIDPYFLPVPPDHTIVTLHASPFDTSFAPADCVSRPVYSPDTGVFISCDGSSSDEYAALIKDKSGSSVYDRIAVEPEQSYARARREIPELKKSRQLEFGRYVCLGADSNRQEFALSYNG